MNKHFTNCLSSLQRNVDLEESIPTTLQMLISVVVVETSTAFKWVQYIVGLEKTLEMYM